VYFAVDHYHIEIARVELRAGDDDEKIVAHLWRTLDAAGAGARMARREGTRALHIDSPCTEAHSGVQYPS
jgi:hypothetical protein